MLNESTFHLFSSKERIRKLKKACKWCGVRRGRAIQYIRLLDEYDRLDSFSEEHFLASFESFELIELFDLWNSRSSCFPGVRKRIADVYSKGPVLSDKENTRASSNRSRNDAYCYVVAGRFLEANIDVVAVDGISRRGDDCESRSDLLIEIDGEFLSVECKRLQSENQLLRRSKKAHDQLLVSGNQGIIALDCSALFRPRGTVFQNSLSRNAKDVASDWLEKYVEPKVRDSLSVDVLGFLLFCRIPAMTPIRIVGQDGKPINRRDTVTSWLGVGNRRNSNYRLLAQIISKLHQRASSDLALQQPN